MKYLDVRGQTWNLVEDGNVARFLNKKQATAFAKSQGWKTLDVTKAANRFCIYWVITQEQSTESLTFLCRSGETLEIPHPGFW
jgi:hypothetical protein